MFILGAAAAHPDNVLTDEHLASLGVVPSAAQKELLGRFGVRARRTTLPIDFITESRNADVLEARKAATASPTSLAVAAAREALSQAGIAPEQLGLIVADCATPYQTCPSEAHRIGGMLGLKVPSYDVTVGFGALPHFFDMLSSWKPERVPDYVLCVSANAPTQQVRYGADWLPACILGDAASALVISPRHKGKLKVAAAYAERDTSVRPPISVVRAVSVLQERLMPEQQLRDRISAGLLRLGAKKGASLIGPQLFAGDTRCIASSLSLPESLVADGTSSNGFALGSSAGCALAALWGGISAGGQIAIVHEGDGNSSGALLEAV